MKNKLVEQFGGHICNTCEYYDPMQGLCQKDKKNHYCIDECDKWKIAKDLIQHRKKKDYKIKKVRLF